MNDSFGRDAVRIATLAAGDYLRVHAIPIPTRDADLDYLSGLLSTEVQSALPEALADAREALACRMTDAAVATFGASMRLAGIRAAQRYEYDPPTPF